MKRLFLLFAWCLSVTVNAQDKSLKSLPDIMQSIVAVQGSMALYIQAMHNNGQENDVNSIVKDIELYLDSLPKNKSYSDQLLMKEFNPLRHFFLTTTNKTTVATGFLYSSIPYQFCTYNDTAAALYIYAIKDGDTYNLGKMTERKAIKNAFENCLLPSLKALDEFKNNEIKYVGLSIYYGCKDTRDGAPNDPVVPYCLTFIARLDNLQQYAAGLITAKGLMENAELYTSDEEGRSELKKIKINVE